MSAVLHVLTYKDGLLARLAHDLQLTLTRFEVTLSAGEVEARFDLRSLQVDGVMHGGQLDAGALSPGDREQILGHAHDDVLLVAGHPEARFTGRLEGAGGSPHLSGELSLRGRAESQPVELRLEPDLAVARARLVPSRWGIRPFKALAGAIRLQDAIDVELRLPREGNTAREDWADVQHSWRVG